MAHHPRTQMSPRLEALEDRSLPSGHTVPIVFLLTPIPPATPLAEHIHVHLTIVIGGHTQVIPAGIGLEPSGDLPIHTHDNTGRIHIESSVRLPFRLRDFFTVWGQPFNRNQILGLHEPRGHHVTMIVDGRRSAAFGHLLLRDGQSIVISG